MGKILTAKQVKRLPVGTDILLVDEKSGKHGMLWIIKSGRKKMLKGVAAMHEIKDREGFHYEEVEDV